FINASSELSSLSTSPISSYHFQSALSSTIRTALPNFNLNFNGTKANFSIVTYVQSGETSSVILLLQNIATKLPNENIIVYDLGLNSYEYKTLIPYCNFTSVKCTIVTYDLSVFPSHVQDKRMLHAYRPIVIKDALLRSKTILFLENTMRLNGTSRDIYDLLQKLDSKAKDASSKPDADVDSESAQSNGCKYNKKPQYRYSGCHAYDTSALNIVLGLTWHMDDSKYSIPKEGDKNKYIFSKQSASQSSRILDNRRRNITDTSEHPYSED
uniref:Uncharacterized protein n=1 Tax=Megaselia scalaris TaxID=36166 RepID=T1GYI3_MEGSC